MRVKQVRRQGRFKIRENAQKIADKANKRNKSFIYKVEAAAGGGYELAIYRKA